jgi:hypothetical protein
LEVPVVLEWRLLAHHHRIVFGAGGYLQHGGNTQLFIS